MTPSDKTRLKILVLTPWYPTRDNPAPGVFVLEHARAAALRHEVMVAVTTVEMDRPDGWSEETEEEYGGLRTVRFRQGRGKIPKARYLARLYRDMRFLENLVKRFQPDLIHAHNFLAAVPAALVKRKFGIPFVVSEHWSGFYRGTVKGAELLKARFGLRRADRVLPVSEFLANLILVHNISTPQTIIPNAIDTELFKFDPALPSRELSGGFRTLAVGNLTWIKGMDLLVEAAAMLRNRGSRFEILIAGKGEESERLSRLTVDMQLQEHVKLLGVKPKWELAAMMRECDFFISASRGETFAVALVEAMSAGLPVVATNVGATSEVMDASRGMLVEPENPLALAEGILAMSSTHQNFDRSAISKWVGERFNFERVGGLLNEVYLDVSSRSR